MRLYERAMEMLKKIRQDSQSPVSMCSESVAICDAFDEEIQARLSKIHADIYYLKTQLDDLKRGTAAV
jgi:hypothetical protein